jgi:Fe(3+) dicitrate transport protein
VRYHREDVTRRRFNGFTPTARETDANVFFRDWNTIRAHAGAAFVRSQFTAGDLILTPGVRLETIHATNRVLRRGNVERNQSLAATQTLLLPGMGVTYRAFSRANFFAGVHQGFAPPRPDDNFDPLDPNVVPVNAERSTNYEAGVRAYPFVGLQLEATVFRMDFANQIVAGETVGLPQLTWANGGKTLNAGAELSVRYDLAPLLPSAHNLFFALAYTNLFTAKFNSDLIIDGTNVRGFRSPYAPRHLFSPSMTYQHRSRFNATLSAEVISRQFGDALNTMAPGANGQEGLLPGWGTYNAAVNIPVPIPGATLFLNGTNLADRRYIVSRVDGIHPGRPRQVFGGLRWMF